MKLSNESAANMLTVYIARCFFKVDIQVWGGNYTGTEERNINRECPKQREKGERNRSSGRGKEGNRDSGKRARRTKTSDITREKKRMR